MKILIVHHGQLPHGDRPVAGVALRAHAHGRGLAALGHTVLYATRSRDAAQAPPPPGETVLLFSCRAELNALARSVGADAIIAVAPDELPALQGLGVPLIADLYAPRILEAQFQSVDVTSEVAKVLDAMASADAYLVTTERQRFYALGLLPLAGVDCRADLVATVPLSVPPNPGRRRRSRSPLVVAGGVQWPWQDPTWALTRTLAALEQLGHGSLHLFGGAYPLAQSAAAFEDSAEGVHGKALVRQPLLGYSALLQVGLCAWFALDVMASNPERALALSFRQMDWLGCGLPLIVGSYAPIAADIEAAGAGWVVAAGDEAALDAALAEALTDKESLAARAQAARALGQRKYDALRAGQTLAALLEGLEPRRRQPTAWASLARDHDSLQELRRLHAEQGRALEVAREDRLKKDMEVQTLNTQLRGLMDTVGTLSEAVEHSLHFKREHLDALTLDNETSRGKATALEREVELLRKDMRRKDEAMRLEVGQREALKAEAAALAERVSDLEARLDEAQRRASLSHAHAQRADERRAALQAELEMLSADHLKKTEELADKVDAQSRLKAQLEAELELARADGRGWREIADARDRDIEKKNAELIALQHEIELREQSIHTLGARLAEEGGALSARVGRAIARWRS